MSRSEHGSRDPHGAASTRWKYHDPALLWLYPVTLLVHLGEEWRAGGGFVRWMAGSAPQPFQVRDAEAAFVGLALIALTATTAGVWLAARHARLRWIGIALAVTVLSNALAHLAGSVLTRSYSPGLVSGVVLWVPLGLLTLLRAWHQAGARAFRGGAGVGLVIQAIAWTLAWIAFG